jgi:DNA-binding MarR family transcriptional regulator
LDTSEENFKNPFDAMKEDYDLWRLFSSAHQAVSYASEKQLRSYGFSHEIAALLSAIYLLGNDVMPIDLARVMRRKPQTITGIVRRMEEKGLIKKTRDANKGNIFRLSLTEKGLNSYKKASLVAVYHKVFGTLPVEKRRVLVEILNGMKASIPENL